MTSDQEESSSKRPFLLFLGVGVVSLGLTTASNRLVGNWLVEHAPGMGWLADAVVPSLIASFTIYALMHPKHFLGLPDRQTNLTSLVRVGAIWLFAWLIGCSIAAVRVGHWIKFTYSTHNAAEIVGFTLIAPMAEELLFRGALFELAERAFPGNSKAVVLSNSTLFMLFHLQFHNSQFTPSALGQMAFAFPLGLALCAMRSNSKSIWPGLVLHSLTNLPGIFGS